MSSRDFADNLQQQARTIGIEKIAQLLTAYQKQNEPIEDDAIIQWFMYAPEIDLHDTSILIVGPAFIEPVDHDGYGLLGYRKYIIETIVTYDLVHDDSNADLITFPKPGITEFQATTKGVKFSGAAETPGTEYQIITDNTLLNPTDKIGICGFIYVPSATTVGSTQYIVHKDDAQYFLALTSKTNMRFSVTRGGGTVTINRTISNDQWVSFAFSYDTTNGFSSYIDKVETLDGTPSGNIVTTSTDLGIWGRAAGTALLENTIALSGLAMHNDEYNQTWVNAFHVGVLDHDTDVSGLKEITFLPYIDSLKAMPNATVGMFIA